MSLKQSQKRGKELRATYGSEWARVHPEGTPLFAPIRESDLEPLLVYGLPNGARLCRPADCWRDPLREVGEEQVKLTKQLHKTMADREWRHARSERIYMVEGVALDDATLVPFLLYQSQGGDVLWARNINEWEERVVIHGKSVPRFSPVQ